MSFLVWHMLAILTIMIISFIIGYSVGEKNVISKEEDFEQVKTIFYKHKKWFSHVRTDYMMRMIAKEQ